MCMKTRPNYIITKKKADMFEYNNKVLKKLENQSEAKLAATRSRRRRERTSTARASPGHQRWRTMLWGTKTSSSSVRGRAAVHGDQE